MESALKGIRVLDMGRVLATPSAGALLGDLGAGIISSEAASAPWNGAKMWTTRWKARSA